MRMLGLIIIISGIPLLFLGYSKKADNTWTMTTPAGYAAPIPMPKTSWKDALAETEETAPEPKSVLKLEMASQKPAASVTQTASKVRTTKKVHTHKRLVKHSPKKHLRIARK